MAIVIGQSIGESDWSPSAVDLFLYSAAVWLPHRIHYDLEYAHAESHQGVVVQGPLLTARMGELAQEWAGGLGGHVSYAKVRLLGTAYAGASLRCAGTVTEVERRGQEVVKIDCELWTVDLSLDVRVAEGIASIQVTNANSAPMSGRGERV